jgi:Ca2+-binding RTX toxin-like protein
MSLGSIIIAVGKPSLQRFISNKLGSEAARVTGGTATAGVTLKATSDHVFSDDSDKSHDADFLAGTIVGLVGAAAAGIFLASTPLGWAVAAGGGYVLGRATQNYVSPGVRGAFSNGIHLKSVATSEALEPIPHNNPNSPFIRETYEPLTTPGNDAVHVFNKDMIIKQRFIESYWLDRSSAEPPVQQQNTVFDVVGDTIAEIVSLGQAHTNTFNGTEPPPASGAEQTGPSTPDNNTGQDGGGHSADYGDGSNSSSDRGLGQAISDVFTEIFTFGQADTKTFNGNDDNGGDGGGNGGGGNTESSKPILIDLDGDGIEILPQNQSYVLFDADDDGFLERTAWVGADDGLLFWDKNGDSTLTEAEQIAFARLTEADDTDLEALAALFDSNEDGVFNADDAQWNEFRIWKDENSNGGVDAGELQSLAHHQVTQIGLTYSNTNQVALSDGTFVAGFMDVTMNGKAVLGGDVALAYTTWGVREEVDADGNRIMVYEGPDHADAESSGERILADDELVAQLGDDESLWIAALGNELNNELDASAKTEDVLLQGNDGDDTLRGGSGDDLLVGGAGADIFHAGDGDDTLVIGAGDLEFGFIAAGDGYDTLVFTDDAGGLSVELSDHQAEAAIGSSGNDVISGSDNGLAVYSEAASINAAGEYEPGYVTIGYYIDGLDGDDIISGAANFDRLLGGAGNDELVGNGGDDELYGEGGDDTLRGGAGDDILIGGRGQDVLEGGVGSDVFVFGRGDGQDTIVGGLVNTDDDDTLYFGDGILSTDLELRRVNDDLVIEILDEGAEVGDAVTLQGYFVEAPAETSGQSSANVKYVQFGDGEKFHLRRMLNEADGAVTHAELVAITQFNRNSGLWEYAIDGDVAAQMAQWARHVSSDVVVRNLTAEHDWSLEAMQSLVSVYFQTHLPASYDYSDPTATWLEYAASYGDLMDAYGTNASAAYTHYMNYGSQEGREPTFDSLEYIASHADLMNALGANQVAGAQHFIDFGRFEHRSVTFDSLQYIATHNDLGADYGISRDAGATHYIDHGRHEGRGTTFNSLEFIASYDFLIETFGQYEEIEVVKDLGSMYYILEGRHYSLETTFDSLEYIASHGDLIGWLGLNETAAAQHYIQHGYFEGRGSSFNSWEYLAANGDLIQWLGTNIDAAARHYIMDGFSESREVTFDGLEYIASHVDLIGSIGTNALEGVKHYVSDGFQEGRTVTFNALNYLASNHDLIDSLGPDREAASEHFILHGHAEGRIFNGFDAAQYLANYEDLRLAFGTDLAAATVHYIEVGRHQGRHDFDLSENNILDSSKVGTKLFGGIGDDTILGSDGGDEINGGDGDDLITGGRGADILTGGAGVDKFIFIDRSHSTASAFDIIRDFDAAVDLINLSQTGLDYASLSIEEVGGKTIVSDVETDFEFHLNGTSIGLTENHFIV